MVVNRRVIRFLRSPQYMKNTRNDRPVIAVRWCYQCVGILRQHKIVKTASVKLAVCQRSTTIHRSGVTDQVISDPDHVHNNRARQTVNI